MTHEAPISSGLGAEIAAAVQKDCFLCLEAPVPLKLSLTFSHTLSHSHSHSLTHVHSVKGFERVSKSVRECGAEIAAAVQKDCFLCLEAPVHSSAASLSLTV